MAKKPGPATERRRGNETQKAGEARTAGGPPPGRTRRTSQNRTKKLFCSKLVLNNKTFFVRLWRKVSAINTAQTGGRFLPQETGFQEGHGVAPSSLGIDLIHSGIIRADDSLKSAKNHIEIFRSKGDRQNRPLCGILLVAETNKITQKKGGYVRWIISHTTKVCKY